MSKNNDWFSSLQRSNEVMKRLCGATTALSQLAESAAWIKINRLDQNLFAAADSATAAISRMDNWYKTTSFDAQAHTLSLLGESLSAGYMAATKFAATPTVLDGLRKIEQAISITPSGAFSAMDQMTKALRMYQTPDIIQHINSVLSNLPSFDSAILETAKSLDLSDIEIHDDGAIIYDGNSCGWVLWPREKSTMGHLLAEPNSPIGANIGLVFCKTSRSFFSPFVSQNIIAHRLFSAMCEITYIAPLYLRSEPGLTGESWTANLDDEALNKLTQYLSKKPEPIEIFDYVYGVLHDPVYCEKYEQYLCRDFPRVPIINTPEKERDEGEFYVSEELYREYVSVGERLRKLHLMQIKAPAELALEPNTPDDMEIGAIKYKNGVLQLNANKRITGISQEAWKYQIGGHQVLDKWFKEHKGETLTIDSYTHIENVVGLLEETIKLREYLRSLH